MRSNNNKLLIISGSRWVPNGWRSKATSSTWALGSITQGNRGQDREIQSRINTASQVFRSLKKSVFTSNLVDLNSKLHFYSCLVLSRLMYGAAESWALTGSQAAQLETFHNSCMRRMLGRYRGTGGPSTTELLEVTRQMPISQLLRRHMVGWLGRRSPQAGDHHRQPTAACRLHPGAPKACPTTRGWMGPRKTSTP